MAATISKSSAQMSLTATCTPTRTEVSNSASVGSGLSTKSFSDANIVYSIKVVATGVTDVATLTYYSAAMAQTTGTPTISDSGVDFEGKDASGMGTIYAVQVVQLVDGDMAIDGTWTEMNGMSKAGDKALWIWDDGRALAGSGDSLILDLNASGVSATVTVVGKT